MRQCKADPLEIFAAAALYCYIEEISLSVVETRSMYLNGHFLGKADTLEIFAVAALYWYVHELAVLVPTDQSIHR